MSQEVIHEYIRERVKGKGRQIVGVIVGTVKDDMIIVGWAKTNLKAGDVYDKGYGLTLALDRARGVKETPELPTQLRDQYRTFQIRCLRYFKQATVLSTKGTYVAPTVVPVAPTFESELFENELSRIVNQILG